MRVNEHCRNLAKIYNQPEPTFNNDVCSFCGSVSAEYLLRFLDDGGDVKWIEPVNKEIVRGVDLDNGKKFYLTHQWDEPSTDESSEEILDYLEEVAGDLRIYLRELNKYF